MTHKEQIKTIRQAWSDLHMLNLQDGFFDVAERMRDMETASERRHRRGAPNGMSHGLTVADASKLFTCSHLLDGWNKPDNYTVDDILHIRTECLYAQAYAKKHHNELSGWAAKYTEAFKHVDYAQLQANGR